MCGIAGIFDLKKTRKIDERVLTGMRDSLYHRGPDEAGNFVAEGVGLAHRRLSIIDLSSGQQPLLSDDKNITLIFNGEIFNFQEIRDELIIKGYSFKTHSDTETILNAWIEWGEKCVDKLRGMFAFVIWDKLKQQLFCARDRLGVKPLLYSLTDDGYFVFGSEHKAILKFPGIKTDINLKSIETYFALGYITDPDSIYQNISKLPAGHTLSVTRGKDIQIKQYWDLPFNPIHLSKENAEKELTERLKQAIDIRMLAEVPLGAFLSGGVDSSAVVALMSQLQDTPVKTCSIGFKDSNFNESEFAKEVAEHCNTDHYQHTIDSDDYDLIDTLIDVYDEPYADSSALPTYRVCELAKKHVTVALSGDGADELMSGYRHHKMHLNEEKIRSSLPLWFRKLVFGTLGKIYPKADWAPKFLRAKSTFQSLAMDSVDAYFNTVSQNNDSIRKQLFSSKFKKSLNGFNAVDVMQFHAKNAPNSSDPQALIQYLDAKTYLISDILTKVDRASMAHSLEVRTPFLDHKWVEWISGIGNQYKYNGTEGKNLLKKTMQKLLPNGILYRKKMGFSVPLATWFRGPLKTRVHETLCGERLAVTGWFNMQYLATIEREHQSKIKDHSTLIWSLVMFDAFLKKMNPENIK